MGTPTSQVRLLIRSGCHHGNIASRDGFDHSRNLIDGDRHLDGQIADPHHRSTPGRPPGPAGGHRPQVNPIRPVHRWRVRRPGDGHRVTVGGISRPVA